MHLLSLLFHVVNENGTFLRCTYFHASQKLGQSHKKACNGRGVVICFSLSLHIHVYMRRISEGECGQRNSARRRISLERECVEELERGHSVARGPCPVSRLRRSRVGAYKRLTVYPRIRILASTLSALWPDPLCGRKYSPLPAVYLYEKANVGRGM